MSGIINNTIAGVLSQSGVKIMCSYVKLFCYLEAKTKHEFKAWILYGYVVPSHNTCKIDQWEKDILDEKLLLCEIKCYTKNSDQFSTGCVI